MHDYYAARAGEYDRIYLKPERQDDLRAIERWLPGMFAGASVLELACGTGYWTRCIAPVATRILAIDAAPETLAIARTRVPDPTVAFEVGDAYAPPRDGSAFDAGFAGFWLSHVPVSRLRAFLAGFHAALAPGATVVFLDNRFVEGSSTPVADTDDDGNTYQLRRLDDGSTHRILKNFPSPDDLRTATAGMASGVRVHEWRYFWALAYTVAGDATASA